MSEHDNEDDRTQSCTVLTRGSVVSHYRILQMIGSGAMGEVYLAEDNKLKRQVALKFLSPQLSGDQDFRTRFIREAQSAAGLNHPNIITIHEVAEHKERTFIAMEFAGKVSLRDRIARRDLSISDAIEIALQVCRGLAKAHQAGIIHRDIKPSNIALDRDGCVKLLDFGLAKAESDPGLTQTGKALGTVDYMSPEQGQGLQVDHRSDIFSVGVVLYEMLTGKCPFRRANLAATIYAIVHEQPEPMVNFNDQVPAGCQRIIDHALQKDRAARYQTADDLMSDLARLQQDGQTSTLPRRVPVDKKPTVKSLAVLYLRNLGSGDDEFLSYGITEDLIVDLTRIGTLRVAPMRSILKFKDSDAELEEIAGKLNVAFILDGSIHKSEKAVRISAQLVDVKAGENRWAERWEEAPENLPKIKQALAQGISRALDVDSSAVRAAEVGTPEAQDPQAYEYYLRGKYTFDHKQDSSDVEVALGLYRQALATEPSLLAARAGEAEILIHQGRYEQARQELSDALTQAQERNLKTDEATILQILARSNTLLSRWNDAENYGNQALQISQELGDLAGEAEALGILIGVLGWRAKFDEALRLSDRVLEIHRQLDDQQKTARALMNMGGVYFHKGESDRARVLFEDALQIARRRNDYSLEAACVGGIGATYFHSGDRDKALNYYNQSLQMSRRLGDPSGEGRSLNNIAVLYFSQGAYRKAIEFLKKASAISKKLGGRGDNALYDGNIAGGLTILGEYDQAIKISHEALRIAHDLDYPLAIAVTNKALGFAHFCKGEHEQAVEYYRVALEIAESAGFRGTVVRIRTRLGELHFYLKNYDLCRENSTQARDIAEDVGEKDFYLKASAYLAALAVIDGQFTAGIKRLRAILEDDNKIGDPLGILNDRRLLGQALLEHGPTEADRAEGRTILEEALAMAREKEVAYEMEWVNKILSKHTRKHRHN